MPVKGRSRFVTIAERNHLGRMAWRTVWDGNSDSKVGQRVASSKNAPETPGVVAAKCSLVL